jgi:hypothetical protein
MISLEQILKSELPDNAVINGIKALYNKDKNRKPIGNSYETCFLKNQIEVARALGKLDFDVFMHLKKQMVNNLLEPIRMGSGCVISMPDKQIAGGFCMLNYMDRKPLIFVYISYANEKFKYESTRLVNDEWINKSKVITASNYSELMKGIIDEFSKDIVDFREKF